MTVKVLHNTHFKLKYYEMHSLTLILSQLT